MFNEFFTPEIERLIKLKEWRRLKNLLLKWPAPDIADLLENLNEEDMVILFRLLPHHQAVVVFTQLGHDRQKSLLKRIGDRHIKEIIFELSPDDRTKLFEELPGKITQKLLNLLPPEERERTLELLGYPENSVGRLVTPDYVAVRPYWTVEQAICHIRQRGRDVETIDMIYVVNDDWVLLDDIPIRRFILADPKQKVSSLMDGQFISISAFEDQEEAVKKMKRYDLVTLPVTSSENVLIGIVTIDDIIDVLEEETTEDFQKGAAVSPFEISYMTASPFFLYKKRIVWLLLLLIADFLSASVIAHFEKVLQAVIALALFMPVLIDSGGNTATQSATLIIRAISTGELTLKKWFNVVRKELLTGILLGMTLGIILYIRSFFWKGGPKIGLVVGLSMMGVVFWANLLGSLLPIILTKFKLDPAVISSPLLTTLIDATGLIIYFSLARWILGI